MSAILRELSSAQQQLGEKIRDADPMAAKSLDALKATFLSKREGLAAAGQSDPQVQAFVDHLERFFDVAAAEIEQNKSTDQIAIRSNKINVNSALRTVQNRISSELYGDAQTQLTRAVQLLANHSPQLSKTTAGQQYIEFVNSRLAEFRAAISTLQQFEPIQHVLSELRGVRSRLEAHIDHSDAGNSAKSLAEYEGKVARWEASLRATNEGALYLQRAQKYGSDMRRQVTALELYQSAVPQLQQANLQLKSAKSGMKGLLSVLERESRLPNLWMQAMTAAAPLQNPAFQSLPEVALFWIDYETTEAGVKQALGDATFEKLAAGQLPQKPKSKLGMKGFLNALNSAVAETSSAAQNSFKALKSSGGNTGDSGGSVGSLPPRSPSGSAGVLPPRSSSSTSVSSSQDLRGSSALGSRSVSATALPNQPAPAFVALVEFQGAKTKLAASAASVESVQQLVEQHLKMNDLVIEFEDSDFPGHYLPLNQLPLPIPPKLILQASKRQAAQSATYAPISLPSSSAVGVSQLDFRIALAELEFAAKIGSGSFGQVFRGVWRGQPVAIKESIVADDNSRAQFLAEVQLMCCLRPHKHIVQVLGVAEGSDSKYYLVMELMKTSLEKISTDASQRALFARQPSALKELALGVAAGMSHLEAEGIVHRDLACRNVLIDDSGTVKISDFGLSRRVGSGPDSAGATQSNIGPIRWMAPENFSKSYSSKSDVWSFACTMVELISGSAPHMHLDLLECALRIRDHGLSPDISNVPDPVLKGVLAQCFQQNPLSRPTFAQIATSLRA